MRSAIICVLFTLIVQKEGSHAEQDDDFRPTPIPLDSWSAEKLRPAGTLQEFIKTDAFTTVAALPAHYWEDALRHSVYLTLVRDKIDELIAKGSVISPDSKPDNKISKEVDDHDLWEKIKAAPFDRVKEDPLPPGDVTILARGKLLEEKNGYRFVEGDEKCEKHNCTQDVKAYWSVKRMRQGEKSFGKYHYELTFSVTSQAPRKIKKPYENPVRTFTIRENTPTERRSTQTPRHSDRSQRAIWFHKNIAPRQSHENRPEISHGLERIFSSLFSDDDNNDEVIYRKPNVYIPHPYPQQIAKAGYVSDREQYHNKKLMPYSMKPQTFRYNRPPLPPPPVSYMQHPHVDLEQLPLSPHLSFNIDTRYTLPKQITPAKQAFLPTPVTNFQQLKESTFDVPFKITLNATEPTTNEPEIITTSTYKMHSNKHPPTKVSYFTDNIRPPVYNAPPGVFATMDKKPFKPMPPLKFKHSSKPSKNIPIDFRPSPQILDNSYNDTDATADSAFRPITLDLTEFLSSKKGPKNSRKNNSSKNHQKSSNKHENIKSHLTTISPDIITVSAESGEDDDMQWAEILGAFTRTTPMASQKEKEIPLDNYVINMTIPPPTTATERSEEKSTTIGTTTSTSTTTTTTTVKPKRTRPPPKFTKPEKLKKHKRITTTTTSTTTTAKPVRKYPTKKPNNDLTPQASSAASGGSNVAWETKEKRVPTTTSSTTTMSTKRTSTTTTMSTISTSTTPSTVRTTTTIKILTTPVTATSTENNEPVGTTQPKSKNRFRQSTLMQKGTSVKHDKWATSAFEKNRTAPTIGSNQYAVRRKASKFQGYLPSSTPRQPEIERSREDHIDHALNSNKDISSTQRPTVEELKTQQSTQISFEHDSETNNNSNSDNNSLSDHELEDDNIDVDIEDEKENIVHDAKDESEYIFPVESQTSYDKSGTDILEKQSTTEHTLAASPHSVTKNNTKCKKKKLDKLTPTEMPQIKNETETVVSINNTKAVSTTISSTTPDIFNELFGAFTMDDFMDRPKITTSTAASGPTESESSKHEQYVPIDDDIEDFLHSLNQKSKADNADKSDEEYEEDNDDEESPFNNDEDNFDGRHYNGEYYDESQEIQTQESEERPYSILELMAME